MSKGTKVIWDREPYVRDDIPMKDTEFHKYLEESGEGHFVNDLKAYLGQFGFCTKLHMISKRELKMYKFIHNWKYMVLPKGARNIC